MREGKRVMCVFLLFKIHVCSLANRSACLLFKDYHKMVCLH